MHKLHKDHAQILIAGCGNPLLGDDGFGPAVIAALRQDYHLPPSIKTLDMGTSIRDLLFDLLLMEENRPDELLIIDSGYWSGRAPGELFDISPTQLPSSVLADYTVHQFPALNILRELDDLGATRVNLLVAQCAVPPDTVRPGLSPALLETQNRACALLASRYSLLPKGPSHDH